ncbi:hypothetical protein GF402_07965 [Candidatus Fermentibacteria bacterium]|nr:hypothetical protein [Candidatus Fermentibacteria bacterium]
MRGIMDEFAVRTGLSSKVPPKRYLWTDAFAVCNFLGLAEATERAEYRDLALDLIGQAHRILGRHREDDPRKGWISGLSEEEGEEHPTAGGLRIGKRLPERRPGQPFDPDLEWERDGQYFHYLTKWAHALDVAARATGERKYSQWARELMERASASFVYRDREGRVGMYWKMSIDLSTPLVPTMGQHDPVDGCVTSLQLVSTTSDSSELRRWSVVYESIALSHSLGTTDPLGIGGLLNDSIRLAQLIHLYDLGSRRLLQKLLRAASTGLSAWALSKPWERPAELRLAFRELGLSIGLKGVRWLREEVLPAMDSKVRTEELQKILASIGQYESVGEDVIEFWTDPENRKGSIWAEHEDINSVMLGTALIPLGYLKLSGRRLEG